jgi:hypothetical protein
MVFGLSAYPALSPTLYSTRWCPSFPPDTLKRCAQVEAKGGLRKCWFVPVHDKLPGKPQALDIDFGPIQQSLLK